MTQYTNRRDFLKASTTAALATGALPYWFTSGEARGAQSESPNGRPVLGCIGTGSRWNSVGNSAMRFSDCVAVCDVDANRAGSGRDKVRNKQSSKGQPKDVAVHEDYRHVLDRDDVDVVTIVTPDHWHTKIAVEAMQAGKDVYCEKPLTLTIEEGEQIQKVLKETGRVFQVGTQQRSEYGRMFLEAVAIVNEGRVGKLTNVECRIGGAPTSGPIPEVEPFDGLNWEKWLGQTPLVPYRNQGDKRDKKTNCHYQFRWWYEYSGGKMTDWGAHHVDIASWALNVNGQGEQPTKIVPVMAKHPVPYENGMPQDPTQYNAATAFRVECPFPGGATLVIRHDERNGILLEGTKGRIYVGRGALAGEPVEALKENPLPEDALSKLYDGNVPEGKGGFSHMNNFFECVESRKLPISDVYTHLRALNVCHLANIAIRLDRELKWDAESQTIVGDEQANAMRAREQRKGYEIKV